MSAVRPVRRPTEDAALGALLSQRESQMLPSPDRLADLLIEAREMGDRYGARLLDCMLDRALGAG